jgi:CDP-4-dehydro-6-deoxyglucose reductase, E1
MYMVAKKKNWPLMVNNISRADLDAAIELLRQEDPFLTQGKEVAAFEEEWSDWLGVKYSIFVNSGSSANLLTMSAIREKYGSGDIIVPTLTWVSDVASVIQCGFNPVFVDINPRNLGMDINQVLEKITPNTKAVFLTHVLGYNGLNQRLLNELECRDIPLVEDVCESHGAHFNGKKLGCFGIMSNFSFYYAHHLTTIEGGMVSTDDEELYEVVRMMRSHGMVREARSETIKESYREQYPDLNPDFIFAYPAYNMRNNEINAVIGRSQLKHLDANNQCRRENLQVFLDNLDSTKYFTEFEIAGNSNYALTLVLRDASPVLCNRVIDALRFENIEFRQGMAGGGNQLRQPYLKKIIDEQTYEKFPRVDHVHFYGFYIGNYPGLAKDRILGLCELLNSIDV